MRKDLVWKEYLSDDERYADIINGVCFRGRQTLKAVRLKVYDPQGRMTERRKKGASPVTKRREITRDTVTFTGSVVRRIFVWVPAGEPPVSGADHYPIYWKVLGWPLDTA